LTTILYFATFLFFLSQRENKIKIKEKIRKCVEGGLIVEEREATTAGNGAAVTEHPPSKLVSAITEHLPSKTRNQLLKNNALRFLLFFLVLRR